MQSETPESRDVPLLGEAADSVPVPLSVGAKAVHAAILTETLELADSLLHQAAKDIEATLFERVLDRLRAQLPELVDRILREHAATQADPKDHG
jgi:Zn-dependent M32 family carboxypeptidase